MSIVNSMISLFTGNKSEKDLKEIQPILSKIKSEEKHITSLSNDQLRAKTQELKQKIVDDQQKIIDQIDSLTTQIAETKEINVREEFYQQIDELQQEAVAVREKTMGEILPIAFAVIKETANRFANNSELKVTTSDYDREFSATRNYISVDGDSTRWANSWDASGKEIVWDMVHYDVQLVGGISMHQGKIAEMHTGEGKTLVATLPLYLNALSGKGVHLVTVNDYLAKRDSAWMAPLFEFHGLTVDCIDKYQPNSVERRKAYNADITYGTNNEFGFDYLRDNMAHSTEDLVQRKHNFAIIDEVDSVLIDDARTPLIISGPVAEGDRHEFDALKPLVANLVDKQRKDLSGVLIEAKKMIGEGDTTDGALLLYRVYRGLPKNKTLIKYLGEEGIKQLLQKTENYYMKDNNREMHKVDEALYFTIDEKNNQIELTEKGLQEMTFGDDEAFFVLPEIGTEIAKIENQGLEVEVEAKEKEVLFRDYAIKSERIHSVNQLFKAYTLFEKDVEYVVMNNKVMIVDEQTGRIMDGRRYSDGLHQAIEAKESVKIEAATQTFATITLQNYFRMYNKLSGMTGTAITEAGEFWEIYKLDVMEIPTNKPIQRNDYNDLIYKTKREKYNALIEQAVKLSNQGRPVLIGTTSVEISEFLAKSLTMNKIKHNVLNAKLHKKEADIVAEAGNAGVVTIATNMAGRGTDIKISEEVKKAGGLAIIGTERHDSRRVDRQLRGRSGRQGDPGSSQFYCSLEDNLMRLFGSDRVAKVMDRMGHKDGEVIQHSMMTKSIEKAQKKVEENNFGVRKRLLEYDDVMNAQREVIYKRRLHALEGKRLKVDISNMIYDTVEDIIVNNKGSLDYKNLQFELIKHFLMVDDVITEEELKSKPEQELVSKLYQEVYQHYQDKCVSKAEESFPIIKNVYDNQRDQYHRIVVPFTDGQKTISIVTDLEKSYETKGEQLILDFEKNISLSVIDEHWKNHLRRMDELKQSVQLAVHEQKDPLLIYKFEAFELFKSLMTEINKEVIMFLFKAELPSKDANQIKQARDQRRSDNNVHESKAESLNMDQMAMQNREAGNAASQGQAQKIETIVREEPKIGRNDRVTIVHITTGEEKQTKYKQAQPLIQTGEWVLK